MTRNEMVRFIEDHGLAVKDGATEEDLKVFLSMLNIPTEVPE